MKKVRLIFSIITLGITALILFSCTNIESTNTADIVIYGGTSAGISAAIQAAESDLTASDISLNPVLVKYTVKENLVL